MDEKFLIANSLVPDNEVWVSQTTFDNPFSKNVNVVLKPSHNNAREKPCASCRYNGRTAYICKNCCQVCFSDYDEGDNVVGKRTASPVA
jgi:Na+-translocating ferredoxin:NAD+ oxidoreductase RnfC subunit